MKKKSVFIIGILFLILCLLFFIPKNKIKDLENYDSFIIGSEKSGAFQIEKLNNYYGASFYNLSSEDFYDAFDYVSKNHNPKNIILLLDPLSLNNEVAITEENPLIPNILTALKKTATKDYNNYIWDIEPIRRLTEPETPSYSKNRISFENIEKIKKTCDKKNINLQVIVPPSYKNQVDIQDFLDELSEITPYWDFSGNNSINSDYRFFYKNYNFKTSVGDMILGKIFNDKNQYCPEDFGFYTANDNKTEQKIPHIEKTLPVLLYHNIDTVSENAATISLSLFESHIKALKNEGYTAVTFQDIIDFVKKGTPLPEKPIIITFDDGYTSNLKYAGPIFEKYNMKGAINVIGVSVGKDTYKETGKPMFPHFSFEEAKPYVEKGIFEIQSHTFDMHNSYGLDVDFRYGVSEKTGETDEEYIENFINDFSKSKNQIETALGTKVTTFCYPFGFENQISEIILSQMGVDVTLDGDFGVNTIIKGLPQSLRLLKRFEPSEETSPQELLERIK
ncbi:MAG: polysaccharide deacetylase family protein [Clostridia bacterium]|nr:polysaccharide deacetylase family protein [Clostridia bacterium]